mmetsp:Transcript_51328/g.143510  ORF Transcript_51328/g.143510 Transcript_51328/m.143510 type:complete len:168 (+) Transcript_51328:95-598(+)
MVWWGGMPPQRLRSFERSAATTGSIWQWSRERGSRTVEQAVAPLARVIGRPTRNTMTFAGLFGERGEDSSEFELAAEAADQEENSRLVLLDTAEIAQLHWAGLIMCILISTVVVGMCIFILGFIWTQLFEQSHALVTKGYLMAQSKIADAVRQSAKGAAALHDRLKY